MKTTVTKTQFKDKFKEMGREDNFSYAGLGALFDWLEQLEMDTGKEMEFDCVALCCDFSEYGCAFDAAKEYHDECDTEEEALRYLHDNTLVIEFDDGIIIQCF